MQRRGAAEGSTAPGARRWTAPAAFARAVELLRAEGLRSMAMHALGETCYRRLLLVERDLLEPAPEVEAAGDYDFGFLDEGALHEYEAVRPGRAEQAAARLEAGDRCFAAWVDGRLAGVRWLATGSPLVEYLDLRLPLGDDEIYHYDTFTDPALRRRGVSLAAQSVLFGRLRADGYRWAIRAVLPENGAAVRDAAGAGYTPLGRIGYVRLGPLRREFVRRTRQPRPAG